MLIFRRREISRASASAAFTLALASAIEGARLMASVRTSGNPKARILAKVGVGAAQSGADTPQTPREKICAKNMERVLVLMSPPKSALLRPKSASLRAFAL